MKVKTICPSCSGQNPYCNICQGEGFILIEGEVDKLSASSCKSCKGKGFKITNDVNNVEVCPDCKGTGKTALNKLR